MCRPTSQQEQTWRRTECTTNSLQHPAFTTLYALHSISACLEPGAGARGQEAHTESAWQSQSSPPRPTESLINLFAQSLLIASMQSLNTYPMHSTHELRIHRTTISSPTSLPGRAFPNEPSSSLSQRSFPEPSSIDLTDTETHASSLSHLLPCLHAPQTTNTSTRHVSRTPLPPMTLTNGPRCDCSAYAVPP